MVKAVPFITHYMPDAKRNAPEERFGRSHITDGVTHARTR